MIKFTKLRRSELAETHRGKQHKEMIDSMLLLERSEREKQERYVTASRDGTMRFWNAQNLAHIKTVDVSQSWVNGIAYMPKSNIIAACSMDRVVKFYDPYTYELTGRIADTGNESQRHLPFAPTAIDAVMPTSPQSLCRTSRS